MLEQRWTSETDSAYYSTPSEIHQVLRYKPRTHGPVFRKPPEIWQALRDDHTAFDNFCLLVFCALMNRFVIQAPHQLQKSPARMRKYPCTWVSRSDAAGKHAAVIWLKCKDALSALSSKHSTAATLILPVRVWQPHSWVSALHPIYFHHCVHDLSRKTATAANLGEQMCRGGWSTGFKQEQTGRPSENNDEMLLYQWLFSNSRTF